MKTVNAWVEPTNVNYRSSAYEVAQFATEAFEAKRTMKFVSNFAKRAGFDEVQTEVAVSAWRAARDEAKAAS